MGERKLEFEQMIDSRELASKMALCLKSIERFRRKGLPHYKLGGAYRYRISEVNLWLKQQRND